MTPSDVSDVLKSRKDANLIILDALPVDLLHTVHPKFIGPIVEKGSYLADADYTASLRTKLTASGKTPGLTESGEWVWASIATS